MQNELDFKISTGTLMKFALPTILSNIFMNIYGLVDSVCVARFIDTDALSAVNIVMPFFSFAMALGIMIGTGSAALVSKQLGEGKNIEAKQNFSFFIVFCVIISLAICLVGLVFREPILHLMGADKTLYPDCEAYAIPTFFLIPFAMGGILLQMFFVAAGKPVIGFWLSMLGGILNVIFDILFLGIFKMGVSGAAWASCLGYVVQGGVGMIYFAVKRSGILCLVKPKWNPGALLKVCGNGMSEMVGMLAVSITVMAMNIILMRLVGSDGVAASAVVMSIQTVLSSAYMGFTEGISPIISYNHGKGDFDNLKRLFGTALRLIAAMSAITFVISFPLARPLALVYADGVETVIGMAVDGIHALSPAFLLMGFNLFASSMFTALNDGKSSAILAFFRTIVFLMIPLLVLPPFLDVWGVWIAPAAAEVISIFMSIWFFRHKKDIYHYA